MKKCTRCQEWKNEKSYHKCKTHKDGLHSYCKSCNSEIGQLRRDKIADEMDYIKYVPRKRKVEYFKELKFANPPKYKVVGSDK